tara:strand:+ start:178519 stop:178677 length:159 start_codon:yes stop_codon:yes gene_type:complete
MYAPRPLFAFCDRSLVSWWGIIGGDYTNLLTEDFQFLSRRAGQVSNDLLSFH